MKLSLGLLFLVLVAPNMARADDTVNLLDQLQSRIHEATDVFEGDKSVNTFATSVGYLRGNAGNGSTPEYASTLRSDLDLVEAALRDENRTVGLANFKIATRDLEIKAERARKTSGIETSLGPRVKVKVITRKAGKRVNGYLVAANPMTATNEQPPRFSFSNPTSPAERSLPPGECSMWLIKNGKEEQRRPVPIGADGEPAQTVFFDVD